ncbi:spike base protein, RCAP_Rcc01079 family [Lacipirellula parvula]|uniref:Uncharacterized protein n=1 Tax=Lacipirellula parvula TaxID=2650471 RepID=A0A5K7X6Z2_9BACT|nr:hypothetical protein [Lacipirellula parvula]BBO32504.1 hypothetical protein PLANPX_2116 [Lacipirellula parvula]
MTTFKAGGYVRQIVPSDEPLPDSLEFIYVGTVGEVSILNSDGTGVTGMPVVAGTQLDLKAFKVTAATASLFGVFTS